LNNKIEFTSGFECIRDSERTRTGLHQTAVIKDRLFERFTQWSANGIGTDSAGLGRAIVKEIVEAHQGGIFVATT
jgi:signal transduction histidine kinase